MNFHPVRKGPVFGAFFDFGEFFQNIYLAVFRSFLVNGKGFHAFFSGVRALSRSDFFPSDPFNSGGLPMVFIMSWGGELLRGQNPVKPEEYKFLHNDYSRFLESYAVRFRGG